MKKKLIALLVMLALVCCTSAVLAETEIASGTCGADGDNLTWTLSNTGVLTISGTGAMLDAKMNQWGSYSSKFRQYASRIVSVQVQSGVTSIGDGAFSGFTGLTSVALPSGLTRIGDSAFSGCAGLTSVTLPSGLTSLGDSAFSRCTGLTNVTLPSGLTSISFAAFYGCTGLTSITLPSSVTSIANTAFRECTGLTSIKLSSGLTSIGAGAFSGCTGLTSIDLPSNLTSIGEGAFEGCTSLTSVTIPSKVTKIGTSAFGKCENLTSIVFHSSVAAGVYRCPKLKNITFSSNVKTVSEFISCESLTSVTIPEGVTTIAGSAFTACENLTIAMIPASVTSISGYAFNVSEASIAYLHNLTIKGVAGSTAQAFAKENGIKFIATSGASAKLDTPKVSSVQNATTGVTIKWGAVTGAEKYRVFYKTGSNGWKKIADTASTSYTWTAAKAGTTYLFTVRCVDAAGSAFTSDYDTKGTSYTVPGGQLATPQITSVTASGSSVTVKWGKVTGAAQYRLFYKKNGSWTKLKDTTGTSVTLNGTTGKTYTYTVRCLSADGKSYTSAYDKTGKSITLGQLATPKITSVTANGTKVTVTWGKVTGAEQYRLFYKKDGKWTKLKDTTATSVTLNGTIGKTYTYTVRCLSADGKTYTSAYDKTGMSITLGQLATPKITSATSGADGITITWGKVSGAAKYRVFYIKDGKWTKLKDTTGTSVTITGGTKGKVYTYTVRCLSADGKTYTSNYDKNGKSVTK